MPLDVPQEDLNEAQRLGARLDRGLNIWYVPAGIDTKPFWRWITTADETRIRCSGYSLAQASVRCWKCSEKTDVHALFVPSHFEYRTPQIHGMQWRRSPLPTILSNVTDLLPEIADQVGGITRNFRLDNSKAKGQTYWMNHCASCGAKIGDFKLHREAQGPFFAAHTPGTSTVAVLYTFSGQFECKGDVSFGGDDLFYVSLEERHYSD